MMTAAEAIAMMDAVDAEYREKRTKARERAAPEMAALRRIVDTGACSNADDDLLRGVVLCFGHRTRPVRDVVRDSIPAEMEMLLEELSDFELRRGGWSE